MKDRMIVKPKLGQLLKGAKAVSCSGVEEWFDFPRYRVVGFHYKEPMFFVETLNRDQEIIGYERFSIDSNQYECIF